MFNFLSRLFASPKPPAPPDRPFLISLDRPIELAEGGVQVNLRRGETIHGVFQNVEYLTDKTRRHSVGRSKGFSVRIMKGLTYRTGGSIGTPVEYLERVPVDRGSLFLTNESLYFVGRTTSFRIPYAKIVSVQPYADARGVMRDAETARMQLFLIGNGAGARDLIQHFLSMPV